MNIYPFCAIFYFCLIFYPSGAIFNGFSGSTTTNSLRELFPFNIYTSIKHLILSAIIKIYTPGVSLHDR